MASDNADSSMSKLKKVAASTVVSLIMIVMAYLVLCWNEGRITGPAAKVQPMAGVSAVTIQPSPIVPDNDGKTIYIAGPVTTDAHLIDPGFDAKGNGLRLIRKVEMYQWDQVSAPAAEGGSGVTEVKFDKVWSEKLVDSSKFSFTGGESLYENPKSIAIPEATQIAGEAKIGDFRLDKKLISAVPGESQIDMSGTDLTAVAKRFQSPVQIKHDGKNIYLGSDPTSPAIGDIRVSFFIVKPQTISVVAQQQENRLIPIKGEDGKEMFIIKDGNVPLAEMLPTTTSQSSSPAGTSWTMRIIGFVLFAAGFTLLFMALSQYQDKIAVFKHFEGNNGYIAGLAVGGSLTLLTIAFAGFSQHPFFSILLIIIVIAGVVSGYKFGCKKA